MKLTDLQLIILFGSHAKKTAGMFSDFDVAVLADHPFTLQEKIQVGELLAEKLNVSEESIDVVDLWDAPPLLQYQIAQYGKLLQGNEVDFIRFKVLAWKRYQDTAKFRRIREKVLTHIYAK